MSCKIGSLKVIKPSQVHKASVIIFHGSGDTGNGFYDWIKFLVGDFQMPTIKFLFPTAPYQPYTPMQGEKSNVWFDRLDINPFVPDHKQSLDSIAEEVQNLIKQETECGIPLNKIIVGGFSMGGALGIQTAYRFVPGLAGVFALSSFLSKESAVYNTLEANKNLAEVPLYMAHGDRDSMVPKEWGEETYKNLSKFGVKGQFRVIKNCMHEIKKQEILDLLDWVKSVVVEQKEEKRKIDQSK